MAHMTVDLFLSRLIGDVDFRESFFMNPLNSCEGLTWSEMAALLCIAEPMLAEFARGVPTYVGPLVWKDDTTNRIALKSH
jgi:hypothetical protein